jgi:hypothetical protein|eukprot:COSAG01_NODE_30539_length_614_cov_0.702913_1_plen_75_part_00
MSMLKLTSWSRYYNNLLGFPLSLLLGAIMNDFNEIHPGQFNSTAIFLLMLTCIVGIGISFAGHLCVAWKFVCPS